ncbi:MAG TPA: hypothetical protein VK671_04695 [Mucilaginibacter sp.]|jgi:hypothetical protein|nr:hypothetical protein [Mucilaginibacter sp.]
MTYEEAKDYVKSKYHFLLHTYTNTVDWVLMDLYISYQSDVEEAVEQRAAIKRHIQSILDGYVSWKTEDHVNYEVESTAHRYVEDDILEVLNYILVADHPRPTFIPQLFSKRLANLGLELSVTDFYRYR